MSKTVISGLDQFMPRKAAATKKPKSAPAIYCVVQDHFVWRGKMYRAGNTPELAPRDNAEQRRLDLHLDKGWIRLATEEDRRAAATAAQATIAQPAGTAATPTASAAAVPVQVQMVPLVNIRPDPTQPRKTFTPEAMKELVDSIKEKGVLQAIMLRPMSRWRQIVSLVARQWVKRERGDYDSAIAFDTFWQAGIQISLAEVRSSPITDRLLDEGRVQRGSAADGSIWEPSVGALALLSGDKTMPGEEDWLEIVFGERRWRGSQEAGLAALPAKMDELTDIEAAELQAIENFKRMDLLPMEDAAQYRKLLDTPGYTIERLEAATHKKRNTIYGKLKLLDTPPKVQEWIQRGDLPAVTGERIGRLKGRVQELAVKAILQSSPHQIPDGAKVPSDRTCEAIIKRIEEEEVVRVRWETAALEAQKKGITPLSDEEAQAELIYPGYQGKPRGGSKFVCGSQTCFEHPQNLTWSKILGKRIAEVRKYLGRDSEGNGHVWMLRTDAETKAKEIGVKLVRGGNSSSATGAREKARVAAERRKRREQVEWENATLAEIVAAIQRKRVENLLPAFWRELASTIAHDAWSDTTRRISARRGLGVKGRANENLAQLPARMDASETVALLAEVIIVGMRGSHHFGDGMKKHLMRMRTVLGLAKSDSEFSGDEEEKQSASARTDSEPAEAMTI